MWGSKMKFYLSDDEKYAVKTVLQVVQARIDVVPGQAKNQYQSQYNRLASKFDPSNVYSDVSPPELEFIVMASLEAIQMIQKNPDEVNKFTSEEEVNILQRLDSGLKSFLVKTGSVKQSEAPSV